MFACLQGIFCFLFFFLYLISSIIALWSEKMLAMISVFLYLPTPVYDSILENVPYVLEKNVYSAAFGWDVLYIYSICSNVSFKASVFCLDDMSIDLSGVLKSRTNIVLLSVSPFMSVNICFMYLGAPMLGEYIYTAVTSLD